MIGKFVSGLSGTGKKIFVVAIVIVVIALFDLMLIGPTTSKIASIDQEIQKEQGEIKQDLHFLGYKDKILKESQLAEPFIVENLPSDEEITAAFLKKIEMLAGKANVTLAKITPIAPVQEPDKGYLKYQADLDCSGKLADVVAFMHLIDSANELTKVVKFNFSSKKSAEGDELKATMTVAKVIVTKNALPAPAAEASGDKAKGSADNASKQSAAK